MSRVHTELIYRFEGDKLVLVHEEGFDYPDGAPICEAKGDSMAAANEQMQMQLNQQLMNIFQTQFAKQSQILDFVKSKMMPLVQNPQGYSQAALNAIRTQSTDQLSGQFQNAQKALNANLAARQGGLPSGVSAQLNSSLLAQEAADKASTQNQITLQNEQLKQANFWNALNVLSGTGAQFNPLGYAQTATSGANAVANLSQAVTASNQSQLLGALGGVVGGAASAALGSGGALTKVL